MENSSEIRNKLNELYKEYQKNKSQLNVEKSKTVADLLTKMTREKDLKPADVAYQLSRFSADIVKLYFERSTYIPLEIIDEVIKEFIATDKDPKQSQYYVNKFVYTVSSIIKGYKENALTSSQLPRLVTFIAKFAVKSEKYKNKFQEMINATNGAIFMLNYDSANKNSLINIWNTTKNLYPDLSKARYEEQITEWAKKYGFYVEQDSNSYVSINSKSTENNEQKKQEAPKSSYESKESIKTLSSETLNDNQINSNNSDFSSIDKNNSIKTYQERNQNNGYTKNKQTPDNKSNLLPYPNSSEQNSTNEQTTENINTNNNQLIEKISESFKSEIKSGKDEILSAIEKTVSPLVSTINTLQEKGNKVFELSTINSRLNTKVNDLETQVKELTQKLNEYDIEYHKILDEKSIISNRIAELENTNSELSDKLSNAYAISDRKATLEVDGLRAELSKSFTFLYEDWLEYEYSDVSEENYETLQVIIKKVFRALERSNIEFKGTIK